MKTTALLKELQGLSEPELSQRLAQTRSELNTLRLKARQGAVEQPHRIRQIRRDIARMLTIHSASRNVLTGRKP